MKALFGAVRLVVAAATTMAIAVLVLISIPFDRDGTLYHKLSRTWSRSILFICGIRVRVHGLTKLDRSRNYVYVSNHASMFDIPAIVASIPDQIRIVYKRELERIPIFGWVLKWGGYIGIDRGRTSEAMKSLDEAASKIRNGASVLLYAEGTRTLDGRLQPFKRGAFNLAVKAAVPVVPLTINGSFRILRKHSVSLHPGEVEIVFDTPIPIEGRSGKDVERKLMEQVHAAIARNYVEQ